MFQFHEGPIKTLLKLYIMDPFSAFQFHEGPIKTLRIIAAALNEGVSIP